MVQRLSLRYQKKIAWFILLLFYGETVLAFQPASGGGYISPGTVYMPLQPAVQAIQVPKIESSVSEAEKPRPVAAKAIANNSIAEKKKTEANKQIEINDQQTDIGGPGQPEMSAFKAAGADNMVDLFTGDFSYNIPLGDVGGYPINIFYNSGISMDQEASWVGLGWNINPGTIMRNMRGVPDDFNGEDKITKEMNIKPNVTVGVSASMPKEFVGFPKSVSSILKGGIFYNNYRGVGLEFGLSTVLNLKNKNADSKTSSESGSIVSGSLGLGFNLNSQSGLGINPSIGIRFDEWQKNVSYGSSLGLSANFNSRIGLNSISLNGEVSKTETITKSLSFYNQITKSTVTESWTSSTSSTMFNAESALAFGTPTITPSIKIPWTNRNYNLGITFGKEYKIASLKGVRLGGYYAESSIRKEDRTQAKPAYGYLYYQKSNGIQNALLDFNRLHDAAYTKNNPVVAIPNYTYDVFSISGQGTGGGFRAYRGDIGSVHDNYTKTKESASSIDFEIGKGDLLEAGLNLNYVHTPTTAGEWQTGNLSREALAFSNNEGLHPAVYFKNPGEATKPDEQFQNDVLGNEDILRIKLEDPGTRIPFAIPVWERYKNNYDKVGELGFGAVDPVTRRKKTWKESRERRTQVISYLTAQEAHYVGLNKEIYYYPEGNNFPDGYCSNSGTLRMKRFPVNGLKEATEAEKVRKAHHLSEITVTNTDGKRYVYGIPVYNLKEEEVSFNTGPVYDGPLPANASSVNSNSQLVDYSAADLLDNYRGKDHFYQKDAVDPYAHSFLLTALLSSDYVDVTGNGVTDDDLGTSVKFNYTKIENPSTENGGFGWRAPFTGSEGLAAYNMGLKTDKSDDKGNYTYGERELWYLNSIESKNMIATFSISNREDGKAAAGALGGRSSYGMKKLDKIDIYSKAEWLKPVNDRRPIKTIHFEYHTGTEQLCQGTPNNANGGGKLTLKRIYFTYNGNNKQKKNYYSFKYHSNPAYDRTANDRWGTYKPSSDNALNGFGALDNSDFTFSIQDKTKADQNAAAWTLNEITLPSGAKINVEFESDDYAYVQNKRAAQMFRIAGFGATQASTPVNQLYDNGKDHYYIFIDAPATSKSDVFAKYLGGINQLFLKLWVRMKFNDQYNPAGVEHEAIPFYTRIADYGWVNNNRFWVKVPNDRGNYSPMFYNSMQFMIKNLPSKAYPGSDVKSQTPLAIFKIIAGMIKTVVESATGYYPAARTFGQCKFVDLTKSYIRLDNPSLKKLGGGIRVKKVTINDNWKKMTANATDPESGMPDALYGQEYDYTTTEVIGGQQLLISSGVAAYEPIVGAEENPFREIMHYDDQLHPWGPNERGAIEVPLGEVFYPSPSVGYSKVTVRSIHRNNVKSGVGKTVTEFYTSRDFPTRSDFTSFDPSSHVRYKSDPILRILKLDVRETITLSQGFRVNTNDMHGKMHKQASYDEKGTEITYTENIYRMQKTGEREYQFNNNVPSLDGPGKTVKDMRMGKEIEVMTDFREHITKAVTFNMNFNINVNEWGGIPVPVFSIIPPVHYAETGYRSAVVLKVINTFGILDYVKHIDKGSEVNTRDLLYDAETGNVLVTETNNEFNKPVYSFNYPAHWAYQGMGGAYKNIDAVYEHLRFQNGKLTTPGFDFSVFESGDELYVNDLSSRGAMEEPGCYPSGPVRYIDKPRDPDNTDLYVRKLWVLDMRKDPNNTEQKFLFIDKNGEPYSGGDVRIKIIRSGKRNLLDASVGAFTSLEKPYRTVGSEVKLVADDLTKILNTTANTFKENWRVDDAFYTVTEEQRVVRQAPILQANIEVVQSASFGLFRPKGTSNNERKELVSNPDHFIAAQADGGKVGQPDYKHRSWALFDFTTATGLTATSTIVSADLSLPSHHANHNIYVCTSPRGYNHSSINPHYSQWGHSNNFILSRMKSAWPSLAPAGSICEGLGVWEQKFNEQPPWGTDSRLEVGGTRPDWSQDNYLVNIKDLVNGMLEDKFNPTKNYATALMINLAREDVKQAAVARVCFDRNNPYIPGRRMFIDLRYYNCTPDNPIVPNPLPTPPSGYAYCVTEEKVDVCSSHFTRQRMNPYTKGVLGNWRADLGYAYYGNRREADATISTEELSKGGVIATGYTSFWLPDGNEPLLKINPLARKEDEGGLLAPWKWSAKATQFNNRGFELENTDPLGRYNCGLYGYDKTLPVAVANNSKLRNAAYDGFEDYNYQATNCAVACKPQRHFVIDNVTSYLSTNISHTGLQSLKIPAGQTVTANAIVTSKAADEQGHGLTINTTTTTMNGTWVNPQGTGVHGNYFNRSSMPPLLFPVSVASYLDNYWYNPQYRKDAVLDMYRPNETSGFTTGTPPSGIVENKIYARWDGWIQAPLTGTYELFFTSDDGMKVWIDGQQVTDNNFFTSHSPQTWRHVVNWTIGTPLVHSIKIYYFDVGGTAQAKLWWTRPDGVTEVIPKDFLYLEQTDANNTIINGTYQCVKPNQIQVNGNALTDKFSPMQGQRMVFSAWVKEGTGDCHCSNYTNNKAEVFFDNGTTATATFEPTGKVIEGWQRYEGVFTIPANATSIQLKLSNTGTSGDVYWDDLRIHPYNANMKSFVYHPTTLRLMAEQDENNYSTFYEYDDDGTLTRVKKETERGIKTITETRSALQKRITD